MIEVSKNYFLLYHGRNSQDITFAKFKELNQEEYSIYSLVLSISKNYISKMIDMESFQDLLEKMDHPPVASILELYPLQNSILELLINENSSYDYKRILEDIEYLHKEEIINIVNYQNFRIDPESVEYVLNSCLKHSFVLRRIINKDYSYFSCPPVIS